MGKGKRVYIAQTDTIYKSIAAAAKALGVNAANLSKTLSGERKTAGGYTALDASSYTKNGKVVVPNRRSLRAKANRQGIVSVITDPLYQQRKELQKLLIDVNANAVALKKAGISYFAKASNQALKFIDDVGRTKSGLYKTDINTLLKLNEAEIKKLTAAIKNQQKYETYTISGASKAARMRAENLGLTFSQVVRYADIIPVFFNMLDTISNKDWNYEEIITNIVDAINDNASSDEVLEMLGRVEYTESQLQIVNDILQYRDYDKKTRRNILNVLNSYHQNSGDQTYERILKTLTQILSEDADTDLINDFAEFVANNDEKLKRDFFAWLDPMLKNNDDVAATLRDHLDFANDI